MINIKKKSKDLCEELLLFPYSNEQIKLESFLTDFHNQVVEDIAQHFVGVMLAENIVKSIRSYKLDNSAKVQLEGMGDASPNHSS